MAESVTPGTIVHGACGKSWTGRTRSHCGACHETFSCESAANRHRVGNFGVDRRCVHPVTVGLVATVKPWGTLWHHAAPVNGYDIHH